MAVYWDGPFKNQTTPNVKGKQFIGLGIALSSNSSILVGGMFISSPQDLLDLADDYENTFGASAMSS